MQAAYCVVDDVSSLLFHSNSKLILSAVYSACKNEPAAQNGSLLLSQLTVDIVDYFDLLCEKLIFCYGDPSLTPTLPSISDCSSSSSLSLIA